MADVHKLTVQETLNAMGPGGVWDVLTAGGFLSSSAAHSFHNDVTEYHQIGLLSTVDFYFNFHATESDCNSGNDLKLEANTLVFLTVPRGLKKPDSENLNSETINPDVV